MVLAEELGKHARLLGVAHTTSFVSILHAIAIAMMAIWEIAIILSRDYTF
jgi:hypothetical protein